MVNQRPDTDLWMGISEVCEAMFVTVSAFPLKRSAYMTENLWVFYSFNNVLNNQAVLLSLTKQYAKNTKHNTATELFLSD